MISHSFVNIFLIVSCYLRLANALNYVILASHTIWKCRSHGHFIIKDWKKFLSSNAACPYDRPFSQQLLDVFQMNLELSQCDRNSKTVMVTAYLDSPSITEGQRRHLWFQFVGQNRIHSITPMRTNDLTRTSLYEIRLQWQENEPAPWYIEFEFERIICISGMIYQAPIFDPTCDIRHFQHSSFCYRDDSPPSGNMRWQSLHDFLIDAKFLPKNWSEKDWFLFNITSIPRNKAKVSERE